MDANYWENRYDQNEIGWNIGYPSTPISNYIDQLNDKSIKILIPGAGNAYEAEYLFQNGFTNTHIVDIAQNPIINFKLRVPEFSTSKIHHMDFFELDQQFDLIIEQTFFCALPPELRSSYVAKMSDLIKPGGKLIGLLFNFPLTEKGPPYGGIEKDYKNLFENSFEIEILESAYNSIKPRAEKELFFKFIRK